MQQQNRFARALVAIAGSLVVGLGGSGASAQQSADDDVSVNVPVRDRVHPEYRPLGIRAGALVIRPAATIEFIYDDNVFAQATNVSDDLIGIFQAGASISSDWRVHALTVGGRIERREYSDFDTESSTNYGLDLRGRLDVANRVSLTLDLDYDRDTELRDLTQTAFTADSPVRFDRKSAQLALRARQTRFEETILFRWRQLDFDDTTGGDGLFVIDQDFRDLDAYGGLLRIGYRLRPLIGVFAQGAYDRTTYNEVQPDVGVRQDSRDISVLGGVFFDIARVARAEIGIGYIDRKYDDPVFQSISGLNIDAELEYFVTDLTNITFRYDRTVRESNIFEGGGFYTNDVRVRVDHELLPNVLLTGGVGFQRDDYRNIARIDEVFAANAGVRYLFRRQVVLAFDYRWLNLDSEGVFTRPDFAKNVLRFSIQLRV